MSHELNKSGVEEKKPIDLVGTNNLMQNLTPSSECYELFVLLNIFI